MNRHVTLKLVLCTVVLAAFTRSVSAAQVSGELKKWHKVTLTFDGPKTSETAEPNPFLYYRLNVRFTHDKTGKSYLVPGYYAADGDAANTSAESGNKWRVNFCPDQTGKWKYNVSFRQGRNIAVDDDSDAGKSGGFMDGKTGSFNIGPTDKKGRDFRGKGRLDYVGKHHLRFAETGEYFLKCGADAPENFLAYADFDGDFKTDGHKDKLIKTWEPHIKDWKPGDPTWKNGKGKGMIGAINYLASEGMNVFSFLTNNIQGDDQNAFPYVSYDDYTRIDVSRMDQWEIVFEHGNKLGMYLHFKTLETENELLLDEGDLGNQRKLYYRELIARFSHHMALNWNLGEEINSATTAQKKAWAGYLWKHDPYKHHIVIHNGDDHYDLLGPGSKLTGFSLQTNKSDFSRVHDRTKNYIDRSAAAGKPWVVPCDEPGDASHGMITDGEDPTHDNARKNALWGNLMAGGAGIEWYFGYKHPHSDLTCQDYRSRDLLWDQCRVALQFFDKYEIPFWDMKCEDEMTASTDDYVLYKPNELYLVYLKRGGKIELNVTSGKFDYGWFNPRTGDGLDSLLKRGSTNGKIELSAPDDNDWLLVIKGKGKLALAADGPPPAPVAAALPTPLLPADPKRNYPPNVYTGNDQTIMLPRNGKEVTVSLTGSVADDGKSGRPVTSTWSAGSGPGKVRFAEANKPQTNVIMTGAGDYVLTLTASDGKLTASDTVKITVEPFSPRVTKTYNALTDAFIEDSIAEATQELKVEHNRRVTYLKFKVTGLPAGAPIYRATLRLTENGDTGSGTLRFAGAANNDWSANTLTASRVPANKKPAVSWDRFSERPRVD